MPRATLVVAVDEAAEVDAVEAWFARWSHTLTHRSENQGCGCCVDIWQIEAPAESLAALPDACRAHDAWSDGA